ncbi:hypothetical protein Tco_1491730 [Tanacetum coccineum]
MEILPVSTSNSTAVGRSSWNRRFRRRCSNLIPAESNSQLHAHAQATKTYYKHQDSRIKKGQDHAKTKTSATFIFKIFLKDIKNFKTKNCQGRLFANFQDDEKYEHVGQDIRMQDGNDDKNKQGERFKEVKIKVKVKRR